MFVVRQRKKTIAIFTKFVDAWLYVYLECDCFATIVDSNDLETWTVNPAYKTFRPIN